MLLTLLEEINCDDAAETNCWVNYNLMNPPVGIYLR